MNTEEGLTARFQFLQVPHGDGLDMNEPSYVARVQLYLAELTMDDILQIIFKEENKTLKENTYIIPFIYARYKIIPDPKLLRYFKDIMSFYNNNPENIFISYFYENIEDILDQRKSDVPREKKNILYSIFLGFLLAVGIYILATVFANIVSILT
jgi:hypothetical protein